MLNVYVTTCEKYEYLLPDFKKLFRKFWGARKITIWSGNEEYSTQLMHHLQSIKDKYFILLHEDFYLTAPVQVDLLRGLEEYVEKSDTEITRIGLQTFKEGYVGAVNSYTRLPEGELFRLRENHNYLCSFEASIFNREKLLSYMSEDEDPWKTEVNSSRRMKGKGEIVLLTRERVLTYKDAVVHGTKRIHIKDGELFAFDPDIEEETKMNIKI